VSALDPIDVEDDVGPHHEVTVGRLVALLVPLDLDDGRPEDDLRAPTARWDVGRSGHDAAAQALPLSERAPPLRGQVVAGRRHLQEDRVDPPVRLAAHDVGGEAGIRAEPPGPSPGRDVAGPQGGDDLIGDGLSKLLLGRHDSPPIRSWLVINDRFGGVRGPRGASRPGGQVVIATGEE
jgi:hypothetical protein